ncbi:glycosyltransferase [Aurantimonas sp. Leaf443]|uniref:glycosyltransferase n=1 Tax=Aurantimonas sp. Leaf443 TaxID=1736378 RepID=UPI0006F7CE71|nr:glycosyltransferase [Aurantimonas sp. Leaf443]KQT85892.1 hypothetical protein ASG48_04605 [Aurantimonas sp. Leaf443]
MRDDILDDRRRAASAIYDRPGAGRNLSPVHFAPAAAPPPDEDRGPGARLATLLGVSPEALREAFLAARHNGTDPGEELVAQGILREADLARAYARLLDLPCEPIGAGDRALSPGQGAALAGVEMLRTCDTAFRRKLFLLPRLATLAHTRRFLADNPELRAIARVTSRSDAERLAERGSAPDRLAEASFGLAARAPQLSAYTVVDPAQAAAFCLAATLFLVFATHRPLDMLMALHVGAGLLFLAAHGLRLAALLARPVGNRAQRGLAASQPDAPLPIYSVVVALYREGADVVEALVEALARLDWPASRLDVVLACEADDHDTLRHVERALAGRSAFRCIRVPPGLPRTKPKALNFVLPLLKGTYVVLYDAEDAPDPGQLREAAARFEADPGLACLQAPLSIRNAGASPVAALFDLEYAGLFGRFLPFLAGRDLPVPLGGTSNHFVRALLERVGAWDPHNVTEDADLGMRLCRAGHRIGTLERPTLEDAPERLSVWRPQRSRWLKGWMQTWLVHMRDPVRLLRDIGLKRFLVFQLLFAGLFGSALAHPLMLGFAGLTLAAMAAGAELGALDLALYGLDLANILLGGGLFVALAAVSMPRRDWRRRLWPVGLLVFVYWFLLSYAFLRALAELVARPHHWNKTPHGRAAGTGEAAPALAPSLAEVARLAGTGPAPAR